MLTHRLGSLEYDNSSLLDKGEEYMSLQDHSGDHNSELLLHCAYHSLQTVTNGYKQ